MTESPETAEQERLPDETEVAGPTSSYRDGGPAGPAGADGGSSGAAPETPAGAPYETPDEMATRIKDLTADLQRLQAEYVNYKRRVDRDRELVLQNAKFTILSALLPVLDDLDRAREHGELTGGFKAVADSLERIVAGEGLVKFGASGDPFDPRLHEALMHSLSPDVETTTCDKVVQAGYQIAGRVVRPAMVTVVDPDPSGSAATRQPEQPEQSATDGGQQAAAPAGAHEEQ